MGNRGRFLAFLLGAACLAGQASWNRLASAVVGGTTAAAAFTLSAAMVGLALGSALSGALLSRRCPRPVLLATILSSALALVALPGLILQIGALEGWPLLRRTLAIGLLALGHLPFGAVLPCLAAWRRQPAGALYSAGALGSIAGVLAGMAVQPHVALDHLGLVLGGMVLLSTFLVGPSAFSTPAAERASSERPGRPLLAMAFATGCLGLAAEFLWLRVLGFAWESNATTFSLVIAGQIAGLSIGALVARRSAPRLHLVLGLASSGLALSVLVSPLAADVFSPAARIATSLALVGIPALFSGAAFVFLLDRAERERSSVALLCAASNAGSAAAPLVLWIVGPWMPQAPRVLAFVACGYALLALASRGPQLRLTAVLPAILAIVAILPAGPSVRDTADASAMAPDFDVTVLPFVHTELDSTVAVTRDTRTGMEILWIDRGFQGDTSPLGRRIPATLGRVPCEILGRTPRRALVIGLGTGITLSSVVRSGASEVDVAELCPGVIEADRTILAEANGHVLERDGVRIHHADGRTLLRDARLPYDLVVTDMVFPTVVGAGNLFSREFYGLARRRLSSNGLFVHWLPCFLLSPEDLSSTCAAFLEAFPEGTAWIGTFGPRRLVLGLVGGTVPPGLPEKTGSRLALTPSELRTLAAGAAPLRDADPRLEIRSIGGRADGRANLRRILDLAKSCHPAWRNVAEAGMDEAREEELLREAVRSGPGLTDAEFLLEARAYERNLDEAREMAGKGDPAAEFLRLRRAALYPHHGMGNLHLANALAAKGLFRESIEQFEAAIRKSPRSADARLKLALLSDPARARRAFDDACALRPDRPPLYLEIARRLSD